MGSVFAPKPKRLILETCILGCFCKDSVIRLILGIFYYYFFFPVAHFKTKMHRGIRFNLLAWTFSISFVYLVRSSIFPYF